MKNKILSFGVLLIAWIMVMAPPTSAQSDMQSLKTNSTTVRTHSQQLPAAYNSSSWTIVNERTNGEGATTITGVDSGSFIIPNTSTASAPESTQATVVYDNGPHVNMPGTPDLSILESATLGMDTYGANITHPSFSIADDFELVAETEITGVSAYAYQTGATTTTINEIYVTIWDGDPSGGGAVVWGDQTTNVFDSAEEVNAYRVLETDQGARNRIIQKVNASISGLTLDAGTYWLEYSMKGTASSGPWQPPIAILGEATTGDALQKVSTGWQPWLDSGTNTPQGLPFQIEGIEAGGATYCIPEGTNSGRYIDNFSTTGGSQDISNMGSGFSSGGYGDFYDTHTVEQAVGEDVSFEVDIVGGTAGFRIWVDWNQDGVFDTTEEVAWNSSGYLTNHTGSFTVPADALEGDTRMRIVSHWLSTTGDVDPCETGFTYGEFEDYKFTVSGGGGGGQVYCEPAGTNSSYYIDSFSTTGATTNISNLGSGFSPGGYGDFYDTHTVAQAAGEDVEFLAEFPTGQTYGFRIWVDWNQDGVFDTTEEVAWNSSSYGNPQSGSFTVPADALEGETRMRVVGHWLNSSADIDPCETNHTYGEFEDYKFIVGGGSGGGGSTACQQVFYNAVQPTGMGFSSGNAVANDITVAAGESFTMETMTFDVVNLDGLPSEFDLEIFEDNGSGGVGTTTGMTYHFDSSNMTFVENGTFSIYTQYTVTLTLPNIELTADASEDARYWLAIASELSTTGDFTYWVSYDYVTNPDSYPSWQYNDTDGWFEYVDTGGLTKEGIMTVSGICDSGSGGAGCEWTVIVEDTSWGDEVEWELREDGGGNILLSGGGYGNGYYDEQTVTAEGPLEFWITNDGFFGDNTPTYSVSNGTEVLVSGTLTTAETLTFSDLNCDSGGGDPCDAVDVPYVQDFETATPPDMPECTTVVNAGSGNNWVTSTDEYGDFTGTFLEYEYHASAPANSWFFTQGINLEAGTDYEITYGYGSRAAAAFPENLKVAFGDDNDPDAMTNLIAEHVAILSGGDKIMNTVEFTATTSGVFYFGFQAFSGANEWYLYLDDIEIKEADSGGSSDCISTI